MSDWIILGGVAVFLVAGALGQARRTRTGAGSSGDGGNSSYGGDSGDGGGGGDGD